MQLEGELTGVNFRPAGKLAMSLLMPGGYPCTIAREPTNKYDARAVQVWISLQSFKAEDVERLHAQARAKTEEPLPDPFMIGYIAKRDNLAFAEIMDDRGLPAVATAVLRINGQSGIVTWSAP